jgi:hypothetical protein
LSEPTKWPVGMISCLWWRNRPVLLAGRNWTQTASGYLGPELMTGGATVCPAEAG